MPRPWPLLAMVVLALSACADRETNPFDPAGDRTPPGLVAFRIVNEPVPGGAGFHTWAEWEAAEPARAVVEYGDVSTERYRHSYAIGREFARSGRIRLVNAESGRAYSYALRLADRAGNEIVYESEDAVVTESQADEELLLVAMIDVGWGDSIYLQAPDGTNTLIDAGHPEDGPVVRAFLERKGITSLDFASLSHVHNDHIGGFYGDTFGNRAGLIARNDDPSIGDSDLFSIGTFLDVEDKTLENGPYSSLTSALGELESMNKLGRHAFLRWGATSATTPDLQWGEGLDVRLLSAGRKPFLIPDFIAEEEEGSVINNDSMVYRVQFGSFVAILTGDAEFASEQFLQNRHTRELLDATVLKLGHHGANDSNSERFLEVVDPMVALITNAISENPGVQHPFVLTRLRNRGIDYYASDRVIPNLGRALPGVRGDVLVWTDGEGFTVEVENVRFE